MIALPLRRRFVDRTAHPRLSFAIAAASAALFSFAACAADNVAGWDGVWWQTWGEFTPMKVVVRDGKVVEWLYRGESQPAANLRMIGIADDSLSFGNPPGFAATLTRKGPTQALGHFHGPAGDSNVLLTKE